jgi:hypothetical protein
VSTGGTEHPSDGAAHVLKTWTVEAEPRGEGEAHVLTLLMQTPVPSSKMTVATFVSYCEGETGDTQQVFGDLLALYRDPSL